MTLRFAAAAHPDLLGSRHRSAPVNAAWLSGPQREVAARFAGLNCPDAVAGMAEILLSDSEWVARLLAPLIDALHADPWFEPPFKVSRDGLRTGAVLVDCAAVSIAATVTSATALNRLPPPATVVIPGRVTITRYVRGGDAQMRRWRADPAAADFSATDTSPCREQVPVILRDGMQIRHNGQTDGHVIVGTERDIVAITATVKPGAAPLMREYAVADGRFVRAASADDAASRTEMLLTFLRVSGRTDAAGSFDAASRHPAFHLRWAAMREWLMLDARNAYPRLAAMRDGDQNAEIRSAANATLQVLDQRLAQPCPA
ncbi:hypothetical protein [Sphingomonas sp. LT1P40]|uniref:hypothetical protein n=1 Tax=Alteristakelama amylovorans TaxID=3096166 RepID=UPI002FCA6A0B